MTFHYSSHNLLREAKVNLKTQLSATPVSTLGVPLDSVIGSQTNPVWKRAILPLLLGKRTLRTEGLLGRLLVENVEENRKVMG